jgi:hypothetical protein
MKEVYLQMDLFLNFVKILIWLLFFRGDFLPLIAQNLANLSKSRLWMLFPHLLLSLAISTDMCRMSTNETQSVIPQQATSRLNVLELFDPWPKAGKALEVSWCV